MKFLTLIIGDKNSRVKIQSFTTDPNPYVTVFHNGYKKHFSIMNGKGMWKIRYREKIHPTSLARLQVLYQNRHLSTNKEFEKSLSRVLKSRSK